MGLSTSRTPRGIGNVGAAFNAAPASTDSGSGGAGKLSVGPLNFGPAVGEIGDITTGRVTLGMVNFTILAMIAFYWWTRSAQGGG